MSRNMPKLAINPLTRGLYSIGKRGFHHVFTKFQLKTIFFLWQFQTTSKLKISNQRSLLSITFSKDSESLKILDIQLQEVGTKRHLNGTSKVNTHSNPQTQRRTNRLIEKFTEMIFYGVLSVYALTNTNIAGILLADLGEARGCSTNTFIINSVSQSVILFLSQLYGAAMPKRFELALPVIKQSQR